jgi:hypothetical protein
MPPFVPLQQPLTFIAMKSSPVSTAPNKVSAFRLFWARRQAQAPAPKLLWVLLVCGLLLTVLLSNLRGSPRAAAEDLGFPPASDRARLVSLDEPVALAKWLNLMVQAHDAQPGMSLSYGQLDYDQLVAWLDLSLALDPIGQYPLMAASRLYTQNSADALRQRKMTDWVASRFEADPAKRWPWMAHIAYVAKNQFKDMNLALQYAELLRLHTESMPAVPAWARQLDIFLKIEMKESDSAKLLIGQLLQSGQIKDDNEFRFLAHTLKELEEGRR